MNNYLIISLITLLVFGIISASVVWLDESWRRKYTGLYKVWVKDLCENGFYVGELRGTIDQLRQRVEKLEDKDVKEDASTMLCFDPNTGKYFNVSLAVIKDIQERLTCLESGLEDAMRG